MTKTRTTPARRLTQRGAVSAALTTLIASLAVGTAGAVVVYRGVAGPAAEPTPTPDLAAATSPSATPSPTAEPTPTPVVKLAPCEAPAKLEKGVCVTEQVRTVVVPPAAPAQAAPAPASDDRVARGGGRGRGQDDAARGGRGDAAGDDRGGRGSQGGRDDQTRGPRAHDDDRDDDRGEDRDDDRGDDRGDDEQEHEDGEDHGEDHEDHGDDD
ncbi:hypothetical protein [Nocardioides sp.]|uniref:hypothetical protein n=1 Tax=Nocardioides sp. TaxID=35761 RepID=UPI003517F3E8